MIAGVLALARVAIDRAAGAALDERLGQVDQVDPQALILEKCDAAVVPPRVGFFVAVVVANLIADLAYAALDPRVDLEGRPA